MNISSFVLSLSFCVSAFKTQDSLKFSHFQDSLLVSCERKKKSKNPIVDYDISKEGEFAAIGEGEGASGIESGALGAIVEGEGVR